MVFKISLCASVLMGLVGTANAATVTFTDQSSFLSSLSGSSSTLDFESQSSGSLINSGDTLGGITFSYSIGPPPIDMMVTNDFLTTSGSNYLGLDDAGNYNLFIAGDTFTMTFDTPQNAIGMYLVSGDVLFENDVSITTSSGSAFNSDVVNITFGDGGFAYYIGLTSDTAFSSATLQFDTAAEGAFLYSIDDITVSAVPVPAAVWLFASGLIGLTGVARRKATYRN